MHLVAYKFISKDKLIYLKILAISFSHWGKQCDLQYAYIHNILKDKNISKQVARKEKKSWCLFCPWIAWVSEINLLIALASFKIESLG